MVSTQSSFRISKSAVDVLQLLKKVEDLGLKNQIGEPSIYYKDNLRVLCHVYDPVATGPQEQEDWLCGALCSDTKFSPDKVLGDDSQRYFGKEYRLDSRFRGSPGEAVLIKHSSTYIDGMAEERPVTSGRAVGTPSSDSIKPTTAEEKKLWWDEPLEPENMKKQKRN